MSTKVKIVLVVVIVIIVGIVLWYMFKGSSSNPYASADTLAKIQKGGYGSWGEGKSPDWNAYVAKVNSLFGAGGNTQGVGSDNQTWATAWLKGFDLERSAANLESFTADIKKYIGDSKLRKNDWSVSTGEYLKATAAK